MKRDFQNLLHKAWQYLAPEMLFSFVIAVLSVSRIELQMSSKGKTTTISFPDYLDLKNARMKKEKWQRAGCFMCKDLK